MLKKQISPQEKNICDQFKNYYGWELACDRYQTEKAKKPWSRNRRKWSSDENHSRLSLSFADKIEESMFK
jgi:hypothetical protein